jgi:hypothetical protein
MEWIKDGKFMHGIRDGKLIVKVQSTGEEYVIPLSKDADKVTSNFWRNMGMEGLLHLAALKKWGDEYVEFYRKFHSQVARQLAKEFMKARGLKEGEATARKFFELALPHLEEAGFFLLPEQKLELLEMNDKRVHARIWSCPVYAAWKKVGISDEDCVKLCKLTCWSSQDIGKENLENWDEAFAHVLNPKLRYRVYQCLPQGKEYCEIVQEIVE